MQTRHPLIDLVHNDETGRYIGHLERKLLKLTLDDMKMRALLELLTGDMWDNTDFNAIENEQIRRIAVDVLKRRLNLSEADAQALVKERWDRLNPPEKDPDIDGKIFAGPDPQVKPPHIITQSRQVGPYQAPYDHRKHLAGLEQLAKQRERQRDQL